MKHHNLIVLIVVSLLLLMGVCFDIHTWISMPESSKPMLSYTPEPLIPVTMYQLNPDGSRYSEGTTGEGTPTPTPVFCTEGSGKWGCTALCDNTEVIFRTICRHDDGTPYPVKPYSHNTSRPDIDLENDYMPNVVAQEMGVGFPAPAQQAAAIASRSYIWWWFENGVDFIENSTHRQVYVPYRFEKINLTATPDNLGAYCQSSNLNTEQKEICAAVTSQYYLSHTGDAPIRAEFFTDAKDETLDGDTYYLKGVVDPISSHPDVVNDGHGKGMSHKGAIRWARGSRCVYGGQSDCDWSITWTHPEQILFHYYTNVHLRDADDNNARLSPNYRWNLLDVTWEPDGCPNIFEQGGTCTGHFLIQNTGTETWLQNQFGFSYYQWQQVYAQQTTPTSLQAQSVISNNIVPGDTITLTLTLPAPPGEIGNRFDTKLEMGQIVNDNWTGFSQLEAGYSWRPYKITTCINTCRANLAMILINSGTGKVTPPAPTPTPAATHTPSSTPTPSSTFTNTPTETPSHTPTPSSTFTHTPTTSPSATSTQTQIPGPTRTPYPTRTPVGTAIFATATPCTSTSQHGRGGENMCKPTPCSGSGRNCPDVTP